MRKNTKIWYIKHLMWTAAQHILADRIRYMSELGSTTLHTNKWVNTSVQMYFIFTENNVTLQSNVVECTKKIICAESISSLTPDRVEEMLATPYYVLSYYVPI